MTHKYYDFYMRFPSFEDAQKAQQFYNETHRPRIGGKFVINDNGVCSLSITDECELICDIYQFGMKRFIVVDNYHGQNRKDGKMYFDFQTDTDVLHSFLYDDQIFENINKFLKDDIYSDGYENKNGEFPPIIKRHIDSMGVDDIYDMLSVNAPGFDI
mgnify:FL=1